MQMITSEGYTTLKDRRTQHAELREQLERVINALPTQIHPDDRSKLLEAILVDLSPNSDAVWTGWPNDIHLLALTAIKSLGRNPIGSEPLLAVPHFQTILFHSSLPSPPPSLLPSSSSHGIRPSPASAQALEALKIIANLLVLHAESRRTFAELGGGSVVAQALAGLDGDRNVISDDEVIEHSERLFLLGRIGFLVTLERGKVVAEMVEEEDVIKSLAYHLALLPPIQVHFMALTELLKLVNNVIRYYPHPSPSPDAESWTESFDILLAPCLNLLHSLPFSSLAPPLSTTLHVLLAIPFLPLLLSTWESVPEPKIEERSSPTSTSSVKNLLNRISISSPQRISNGVSSLLSSGRQSPSPPSRAKSPPPVTPESRKLVRRPSTPDQRRSSPPKRLSPLSRSPKTPPPPSPQPLSLKVPDRPLSPPSTRHDPTAFPGRVFGILRTFFDSYLPGFKSPDAKLEQGLVLDEALPPVLLLLARATEGSEAMRRWMRTELLPPNLDRSPESRPLEKRPGLLGTLLRCMNSTSHWQTRDSAGELLWAICDGDASTLCAEIGYGNAAGLLFRKGISGPPPGKIEQIDDVAIPSPTLHFSSSMSGDLAPAEPVVSRPLNPITALDTSNEATSGTSFDDLSEEEQEREAAKLFDLFDRLDRNPILKAQGPNGQNVGIKEAMKKRYAAVDEGWADKEKAEEEAEEKDDEEAAAREMEAYKKRMG